MEQNMRVQITQLPTKGQLFQAQFEPNKDPTYTLLAHQVDAKDDTTVAPATKVTGPLLFNWNKEGAVTGDGWDARRKAILDGLKADEILEITGQYRADCRQAQGSDGQGGEHPDISVRSKVQHHAHDWRYHH